MAKLKDTAKKTLTIKVTPDLYNRVRMARAAARQSGKVYNVSESVADFLERDMKRVYKELDIEPPKKTSEKQSDLFVDTGEETSENNDKKTSKKAPRSGIRGTMKKKKKTS